MLSTNRLMNSMQLSQFDRPVNPLAGPGLAVLLVLLAALTGCVSTTTSSARGEVTTYAYRDLDTTVAVDFNQVVESARRAIKELEFIKVSDSKDAYAALLVARTALDKKATVTITNSGKNLTNIKIRVGLIGDRPLSMAILDKIRTGW